MPIVTSMLLFIGQHYFDFMHQFYHCKLKTRILIVVGNLKYREGESVLTSAPCTIILACGGRTALW